MIARFLCWLLGHAPAPYLVNDTRWCLRCGRPVRITLWKVK